MKDLPLPPVHYRFVRRPNPKQMMQIRALYQAERWWEAGDDTARRLITRLIAGSHCFVTARAEGRIVGMGRAISDGVSDAYIQDVTVAEPFRHRGVGGEIVRRLVDRLRRDGLRWIALVASGGRHPFYEPLGFRVMPDALPMRHGETA